MNTLRRIFMEQCKSGSCDEEFMTLQLLFYLHYGNRGQIYSVKLSRTDTAYSDYKLENIPGFSLPNYIIYSHLP